MAWILVGLGLPAVAQALCGDGVHDVDEACDDHGKVDGDGCTATCQIEEGWVCTDASLAQRFVEVLYDESDARGGYHAPPEWAPSSTGNEVRQLANSQPSIYGTGLPMSDVHLSIDITTPPQPDDFFGLAIGYEAGEGSAASGADWILIDWLGAPYRSSKCKVSAGLSISRVKGPLPPQGKDHPSPSDILSCHQDPVTEIARASGLGDRGWKGNTTYRVEVDYSRTNVRVTVDGEPEISISGEFPEGNLGLYAFGQDKVTWTLVKPRDRTICAGLDEDRDGVSDAVELRLGMNPQRTDSDDDSVPDDVEVGDPSKPLDSDLDQIINALDTDDDGDGAPTVEESWDGDRQSFNDDSDRDGLPDYLDGDDDGDGISTSAEAGASGGLPTQQDTDADGLPDMVDLDDDGDGVPTAREKGPLAELRDSDQDGTPDLLDADDDGDSVPTGQESYDGDTDPNNDDTDRDGLPDYLDIDDDNDGTSTQDETQDSAGTLDRDFDGRPDHIDRTLELPEGVEAPDPNADQGADTGECAEEVAEGPSLGDVIAEQLGAGPSTDSGRCATVDSNLPLPWLTALALLSAARRRAAPWSQS